MANQPIPIDSQYFARRDQRKSSRKSSQAHYRTTREAIQLEVVGYVLKDTPVAALRQAILDVHEGGRRSNTR